MDGSGYPRGLKGGEIPAGGRILAIADIFDALTSERHYRDRMDLQKVIRILKNGSCKLFDAEFVECFRQISLYDLVQILEHDYREKLFDDDLEILKGHNLGELGLTLSTNSEWEQVFYKYYLREYLTKY